MNFFYMRKSEKIVKLLKKWADLRKNFKRTWADLRKK